MGFENVESIFIDNKEVQSIVVKDSGGILFQKSNDITNLPIMTLTVAGSSFSTSQYASSPFSYNGRVCVDWGDDSDIVEYTGGSLTHTYSSSDDYTVKIYGDITSLRDNCFDSCTGLTSIVIPNNVTSLGRDCFYGCSGLTSIILNWDTNDEILTYSHYWIRNTPSNLLFHIPNGTKSLYTAKEYPLEKLEEELSDNIMELEIQHNLNIYLNNPFTYTGRVFVDWGDNTGLIEYTGGELTHTYNSIDNYTVKIYGNITSLETSCFESCNGLTSITIPNSVTNLGEACFHSCRDLTSISIPSSVTSIGDYCFTECESLTSISIPSGVTSLGTFCFSRCESLTSINIPSGVTSLGAYCFEGCTSLTSIVIPNTVIFMGEYCFVSCYALTNIKLNFKTSINILAYDSSWIIETNNLKFSIPNGTTSLYTDKGYPLEKLEEIYDEIELTTDKSILSYADNETCTLTAQLLKESVPFMVSGVTVEFFNGNISLGTALTNSNGIATKTYNSQGIGDLTVYASDGNIISGDILIEDCLYYSSLVSTNAIIAPWTDNCTVEYEVYAIDTWNWHYLLVFQEENQEHIATLSSSYDNSSSAPIKTTNFPPKNTWTPIQFKTENGTATVSSNGTVKGTTNISLSDLTSIKIYNSKSNTQQRNVKIKPL